MPFVSCLHFSAGYRAVLLLGSLEEIVLLAGAAVVVLVDAQHKRGSSCFTLGGKLRSLLPTPQPLYQGRATHKLTGTPDRVAMR